MNRLTRFFLLATFVIAILLIVILQFISNRSINHLISGNQEMLEDFHVKSDFNELKENMSILESRLKGLVISGYIRDTEYLRPELQNINHTLELLDKNRFNSNVHPYLKELKELIAEKILFNRQVLDTLRFRGKPAAELMINSHKGAQLAAAINNDIIRISELHRAKLTTLIESADNSGRKAKAIGTLMAITATLASVLTFSYALFKVNQQQKLIGLLNISEQKALKAGRAKEDFLSNMSHEIRTPLNAILGFTHLLSQKQLEQESKGYVQTIQKSGENLLTIINDVLDLSKIEAGEIRFEKLSFNIRELVQGIERIFRPKSEEMKLRFVTEMDQSIPYILLGDPAKLNQILVNILSNAFKFTSSGEIIFAVSKGKETEGNRVELVMTTKDTGIGIDKDRIDRIFERFKQAEDSITRKYGGTGLGLSIVKELVELQGGTVSVVSVPGRGSTFTVILPFEKIAEASQHVDESAPPESPIEKKQLSAIKILVVEDNKINQLLLQHIFKKWGIPFSVVNNGREAIAELEHHHYQLILMDIQMPEMDGYSATTYIRNRLHNNTPIIAMTAHAMTGEKEKCLSYGMNNYISKPLKEDILYRMIVEYTGLLQIPVSHSGNTGSSNQLPGRQYQFIQLDYLNEVAAGDNNYKRIVTTQFLAAVPEELEAMKNALKQNNLIALRKYAHNFKTTISVMGLNNVLNPGLDILESETSSVEQFHFLLNTIIHHSEGALNEAQSFLQYLNNTKVVASDI